MQEARAAARGLDDRTLAARLGALELKRSCLPPRRGRRLHLRGCVSPEEPVMTRQRFEVFTPKHGDVVFTTRFHFVARLVTRFVKTLEYDHPIPLVPTPCELAPLLLFPDKPIYWCPDCAAGACPGLQIGRCYIEGCAHDCNQDENPPEFCECEACEHDCIEADCGPVCKLNQW